MNSAINFQHALEMARNQREDMGLLGAQDSAIDYLLGNGFKTGPAGETNIRAVHRRVRWLYLRKTWNLRSFIGGFDWTTVVDWIVEHWADILKIVLAIIPFIL